VFVSKRNLSRYSLFQIPLVCFTICSIAALLFALLGLGRPQVAVGVVLDLSSSTYGSTFNAPGTVMAQSVGAVRAYLQANAQLRQPNQVQVWGMRGRKAPKLTNDLSANSQEVEVALQKAIKGLNPLTLPEVPGQDDLNVPVRAAMRSFSNLSGGCREVLVVSDAGVEIKESTVAEAVANRTKLNFLVFGNQEAPELQDAAKATRGIYSFNGQGDLSQLFIDTFFKQFNSNLGWILFWLGAAWIALMWTLVLPLDRWVFQGYWKLPMDLAAKLALANALFWTTAIPGILWRFMGGLPFFSSC